MASASTLDMFSSITCFQHRSQNDLFKTQVMPLLTPFHSVKAELLTMTYWLYLAWPPRYLSTSSPPALHAHSAPAYVSLILPSIWGASPAWGLCICCFLSLEHSFYKLLRGSLSPLFRLCSNTISSERLRWTVISKHCLWSLASSWTYCW